MAGYGVPEADIAMVLNIDPETLRPHYRRELEASGICMRRMGLNTGINLGWRYHTHYL